MQCISADERLGLHRNYIEVVGVTKVIMSGRRVISCFLLEHFGNHEIMGGDHNTYLF